jgi:hypothetical protein
MEYNVCENHLAVMSSTLELPLLHEQHSLPTETRPGTHSFQHIQRLRATKITIESKVCLVGFGSLDAA